MIQKSLFATIDQEVKQSLIDTLENIRINNFDNYILFLADAEYKSEYDNTNYSSYVIDNRIDYYKDESRMRFLSEFLTNYYTFAVPQTFVDDDEYRLHLELMAYTHIWESKPFLKKLCRLAHINNKEAYNWNVVVPDMSKHDFIRNDIRHTFEIQYNNLSEIIKRGFHTSLRNAFAHSEYSFDTLNGNRRIILDTYTGERWDIPFITFDDWSNRFVYSALLSFYLFSITHKKRNSLIQDTGTDTFEIIHPKKDGSTQLVKIQYRQEHNSFNFKQ